MSKRQLIPPAEGEAWSGGIGRLQRRNGEGVDVDVGEEGENGEGAGRVGAVGGGEEEGVGMVVYSTFTNCVDCGYRSILHTQVVVSLYWLRRPKRRNPLLNWLIME